MPIAIDIKPPEKVVSFLEKQFQKAEKERLEYLEKASNKITTKIRLTDFGFNLQTGGILSLEALIQHKCFVDSNSVPLFQEVLDSIQKKIFEVSFLRKKVLGDPLDKKEFQKHLNIFFGMHFFLAVKKIGEARKFDSKSNDYHRLSYIAFQHFYNYATVYGLLRQGYGKGEFKYEQQYSSLSVSKLEEKRGEKTQNYLDDNDPGVRETYTFYEKEGYPQNSWRIGRNRLCEIFKGHVWHQKTRSIFQKQLMDLNDLYAKKWTLETLHQLDNDLSDTPFPDGIDGVPIDESQ